MTTLIHPTAVIHSSAELHPSVQVGAYAVIGAKVKLGLGTMIAPHVVLDGWIEMGARNQIFPGVVIGMPPQDFKYDGLETLVKIGDDNCIREHVTIHRATGEQQATVIGNSNLLMAYSHVGHNCVIGDRVTLTNSVLLGGHVQIESRATVGGAVAIHQFVQIGRLAMVGGMSRINRDVPPYMLVEGNPARVRSLNRIGVKRSGLSEMALAQNLQALKQAFRILYRSGLPLAEALEQLDSLNTSDHVQHLKAFLEQSSKGRRGPTPGKKTPREKNDGSEEDE